MAVFDEDPLLSDELEEIKQLRKDSSKHQADWRQEARNNYQLVAGDQWSDGDKARLEEQNRPCVTFNRVGPIVDSVVGYEINNRRETRYLPRTMSDRQVNTVYTEAARWVRDRCDAEDEESEAFRDVVVAGMGWMETLVDYEEEAEGQIRMERVSPLEMRWDPNARRGNVEDAMWVMREKWLDVEEIQERWPDKADEIVPTQDQLGDDEWLQEHDATNAWKYENDQSSAWYDPKEAKALIIQYQFKEREDYWLVGDTESGRVLEAPTERFDVLRDELDRRGIAYVRKTRWAYRQRIVCGETILEDGDCPISDGFSFRCMTGKRDEEHGWWYGLVRAMRGPQEWANVFFSQAMHAMQANSKGGLIVEETAVGDMRQLEEKWADPSGIVTVEDGALSGGRIQEKSFGGYPPSLDKLMQFSIQSIRDVTGVNLEMLGMVGHEQTGILEIERKKSALTILAPIMNSVRRYRKIQGRDLLSFMRRYIREGTIMRITDREVPFWKDDDTVKYDIIVDDAPTSPNLKNEVWQSLQNILPAVIRAGVPLPPDIIKFSPLPDSVADGWVDYINKQQQQPDMEAINQQAEQMQAELNKLQKENIQLKDKREAEAMSIQARQREADMENQIKQQQMAMNARMQEQELLHKMKVSDADRAAKLLEIEARYNTEMARIQANSEVQLATTGAQVDAQREQAVISLQTEREKREEVRRQKRLERQEQMHDENMPEIEETAKEVDKVAADFQEYKQKQEANRSVILAYLKSRGGEVAELAEKLEA